MKRKRIIPKFILFFFLSSKQKKEIEEREVWGKHKKSESGVIMHLPRYIEISPSLGKSDSKEFLEEKGFRILGIACRDMYIVEPPQGCKTSLPPGAGAWRRVIDSKKKTMFKFFDMHHKMWRSACYIIKYAK